MVQRKVTIFAGQSQKSLENLGNLDHLDNPRNSRGSRQSRKRQLNGTESNYPSKEDRIRAAQADRLEEPLVLPEDGGALSDDLRLHTAVLAGLWRQDCRPIRPLRLLLNVARSSIQELLEDYEDYLPTHHQTKWSDGHPRYNQMLSYCREHNYASDYEPFFEKWTDEEIANIAITLCHMVDKMMMTYQKKKEEEFVTEGGIRERMTAARLGYRTNQREAIEQLTREVETLRKENVILKNRIKELEGEK